MKISVGKLWIVIHMRATVKREDGLQVEPPGPLELQQAKGFYFACGDLVYAMFILLGLCNIHAVGLTQCSFGWVYAMFILISNQSKCTWLSFVPTTMRGNPHYKSLQNGLLHMVVVCAYYHVRRYSFQGRTEGVRSHGGTIFRPPCEGILIQGYPNGSIAHGGIIILPPCDSICISGTYRWCIVSWQYCFSTTM